MSFLHKVGQYRFFTRAKITAGDLLKFIGKKDLEALRRKKHNKEVIKKLKSEKSHSDDSPMTYNAKKMSEQAISKIKEAQDLGQGTFAVERLADDLFDVELNFWDELEERGVSSQNAKKLAKEYLLKYGPIARKAGISLERHLLDVYERGGPDTLYYYTYQFYLLPEKLFGEVNTGPSKNLLNPSVSDIGEAMTFDVPYWVICIYSDDKKKYQRIVRKLIQEGEKNVG